MFGLHRSGAGMGLLFGIGTAIFALWFTLRLVPKLIGMSVWLGSAAVTGTAALAIMYILDGS